MDNETRQKIQKLEGQVSQILDQLRKLTDKVFELNKDIILLKEETRANKVDIQILKDGGNI